MRQALVILLCAVVRSAAAQERGYFVTYDHYLEETGNLEMAVATTNSLPREGHTHYTAPWLELEYGVTGWWTSELYLEGVTARHGGSGFTGWRWENRFRPLKTEHRVNPVIYVEYENISEASRIQKEVVGRGQLPLEPIDTLLQERAHELEGKLILSSQVKGWNVSENIIVEKNLSKPEGLEFGYSLGVSRALGGLAGGAVCHLCRENFVVGIEAYGGLGTTSESTLSDTRHFLAPVVAWHISERSTLKFSAGFGLTDASDRALLRVGYAYELPTRGR